MTPIMSNSKLLCIRKIISAAIAVIFIFTSIMPPQACAQIVPQAVLNLPQPGAMLVPTDIFNPLIIKGVKVDANDPLHFNFIVELGDKERDPQALNDEAQKAIKYFLAALTVPEKQMWVNLSPYEKDRVIPNGFSDTLMGRDMLAQDYMLKQLTASLMHPEKDLGKAFWDKVYAEAKAKFGTTDIPVDTFNKVWIIPGNAKVYEYQGGAYILESRLKVMMDEDYLAMKRNKEGEEVKNSTTTTSGTASTSAISITSNIMRQILIPAIEREVNAGETFAQLRQIYNAVILASWYKMRLKDTLLSKIYVDKNRTKGIDTKDKQINEKIYNQYVEAFKKGVYKIIKEEYDPASQEIVNRAYFSGGTSLAHALSEKEIVKMPAAEDFAMLNQKKTNEIEISTQLLEARNKGILPAPLKQFDKAMAEKNDTPSGIKRSATDLSVDGAVHAGIFVFPNLVLQVNNNQLVRRARKALKAKELEVGGLSILPFFRKTKNIIEYGKLFKYKKGNENSNTIVFFIMRYVSLAETISRVIVERKIEEGRKDITGQGLFNLYLAIMKQFKQAVNKDANSIRELDEYINADHFFKENILPAFAESLLPEDFLPLINKINKMKTEQGEDVQNFYSRLGIVLKKELQISGQTGGRGNTADKKMLDLNYVKMTCQSGTDEELITMVEELAANSTRDNPVFTKALEIIASAPNYNKIIAVLNKESKRRKRNNNSKDTPFTFTVKRIKTEKFELGKKREIEQENEALEKMLDKNDERVFDTIVSNLEDLSRELDIAKVNQYAEVIAKHVNYIRILRIVEQKMSELKDVDRMLGDFVAIHDILRKHREVVMNSRKRGWIHRAGRVVRRVLQPVLSDANDLAMTADEKSMAQGALGQSSGLAGKEGFAKSLAFRKINESFNDKENSSLLPFFKQVTTVNAYLKAKEGYVFPYEVDADILEQYTKNEYFKLANAISKSFNAKYASAYESEKQAEAFFNLHLAIMSLLKEAGAFSNTMNWFSASAFTLDRLLPAVGNKEFIEDFGSLKKSIKAINPKQKLEAVMSQMGKALLGKYYTRRDVARRINAFVDVYGAPLDLAMTGDEKSIADLTQDQIQQGAKELFSLMDGKANVGAEYASEQIYQGFINFDNNQAKHPILWGMSEDPDEVYYKKLRQILVELERTGAMLLSKRGETEKWEWLVGDSREMSTGILFKDAVNLYLKFFVSQQGFNEFDFTLKKIDSSEYFKDNLVMRDLSFLERKALFDFLVQKERVIQHVKGNVYQINKEMLDGAAPLPLGEDSLIGLSVLKTDALFEAGSIVQGADEMEMLFKNVYKGATFSIAGFISNISFSGGIKMDFLKEMLAKKTEEKQAVLKMILSELERRNKVKKLDEISENGEEQWQWLVGVERPNPVKQFDNDTTARSLNKKGMDFIEGTELTQDEFDEIVYSYLKESYKEFPFFLPSNTQDFSKNILFPIKRRVEQSANTDVRNIGDKIAKSITRLEKKWLLVKDNSNRRYKTLSPQTVGYAKNLYKAIYLFKGIDGIFDLYEIGKITTKNANYFPNLVDAYDREAWKSFQLLLQKGLIEKVIPSSFKLGEDKTLIKEAKALEKGNSAGSLGPEKNVKWYGETWGLKITPDEFLRALLNTIEQLYAISSFSFSEKRGRIIKIFRQQYSEKYSEDTYIDPYFYFAIKEFERLGLLIKEDQSDIYFIDRIKFEAWEGQTSDRQRIQEASTEQPHSVAVAKLSEKEASMYADDLEDLFERFRSSFIPSYDIVDIERMIEHFEGTIPEYPKKLFRLLQTDIDSFSLVLEQVLLECKKRGSFTQDTDGKWKWLGRQDRSKSAAAGQAGSILGEVSMNDLADEFLSFIGRPTGESTTTIRSVNNAININGSEILKQAVEKGSFQKIMDALVERKAIEIHGTVVIVNQISSSDEFLRLQSVAKNNMRFIIDTPQPASSPSATPASAQNQDPRDVKLSNLLSRYIVSNIGTGVLINPEVLTGQINRTKKIRPAEASALKGLMGTRIRTLISEITDLILTPQKNGMFLYEGKKSEYQAPEQKPKQVSANALYYYLRTLPRGGKSIDIRFLLDLTQDQILKHKPQQEGAFIFSQDEMVQMTEQGLTKFFTKTSNIFEKTGTDGLFGFKDRFDDEPTHPFMNPGQQKLAGADVNDKPEVKEVAEGTKIKEIKPFSINDLEEALKGFKGEIDFKKLERSRMFVLQFLHYLEQWDNNTGRLQNVLSSKILIKGNDSLLAKKLAVLAQIFAYSGSLTALLLTDTGKQEFLDAVQYTQRIIEDVDIYKDHEKMFNKYFKHRTSSVEERNMILALNKFYFANKKDNVNPKLVEPKVVKPKIIKPLPKTFSTGIPSGFAKVLLKKFLKLQFLNKGTFSFEELIQVGKIPFSGGNRVSELKTEEIFMLLDVLEAEKKIRIVNAENPSNPVYKVLMKKDSAMSASANPDFAMRNEYGGINFNPSMLNLEIKRDKNFVPLPIEQQPAAIYNIEGFIPVIINVTPIYDLPLLLGLKDKMPLNQNAQNMFDPLKEPEKAEI